MGTDIHVWSFEHLKDKHNPDKALHMLKRVASLVKPIMRKRSWVLPVLAEFFPDNPNLLGLNVNMGQKILVRLRPPFSPDTFLTEEDVVQTMLHELTHNIHGPHDDKFYKYLSGLQDEYDGLQLSGYAGEGFFSPGHRLGTNVSHNVPSLLARMKAVEAAEKRLKTSRVLGSSGRLGSLPKNAGLSPRVLAARAAEQRLNDETSCGFSTEAHLEADKAAKQSFKNNVIDLTVDDDKLQHRSSFVSDVVIIRDNHYPTRAQGTSNAVASSSKARSSGLQAPSNPTPVASTTTLKKSPGGKDNSRATVTKKPQPAHAKNVVPTSEWACPACTLLNPAGVVHCDACETRKHFDERQGWTCMICGEAGISHNLWTCSWCGNVKLSS